MQRFLSSSKTVQERSADTSHVRLAGSEFYTVCARAKITVLTVGIVDSLSCKKEEKSNILLVAHL